MPDRYVLVLAVSFLGPTIAASAAPPVDTSGGLAVVSPAYEASVEESSSSSNLRYPIGAFFYGNDCGGNSKMTSQPARTNMPGGVILSGAAGYEIAQTLNCDDRRNAMASYRDAFQGKIGKPYAWRNPNGGANGNIMAISRYGEGGYTCIKFRAVATISQILSNSSGTACREQDGNWHTR